MSTFLERTKRLMQGYGNSPHLRITHILAYMYLRYARPRNPKPCRPALRAVHRVGMPPWLEGLRPSPCGIPPPRPVGLWQGSGTRKPPSRFTNTPASRAARNVMRVSYSLKARKREGACPHAPQYAANWNDNGIARQRFLLLSCSRSAAKAVRAPRRRRS